MYIIKDIEDNKIHNQMVCKYFKIMQTTPIIQYQHHWTFKNYLNITKAASSRIMTYKHMKCLKIPKYTCINPQKHHPK